MKILLAIAPVDFRKGIDGLARSCEQIMHEEAFGGALFVFRNRRSTAVKILAYDGQGFWLCQKRLSQGRFSQWPTSQKAALHLGPEQLHALLWNGDPLAVQAHMWRPLPGQAHFAIK